MWFDLVLIDKVFESGTLLSAHIRSEGLERFPVDRLEDINTDFRAANTRDFGPIRIYEYDRVKTTFLESKLKHFISEPNQIMFQLDHFGIPVTSGYYAIVFPRGWRVDKLNIYDPYDDKKNVSKKRIYRDVDIIWDKSEQTSFAQFNMESIHRNTFSIGVIVSLCPADADINWQDKPGELSVIFTDSRHHGHNLEKAYRKSVDDVTKLVKSQDKSQDKMPSVMVSLSGPSLDIVEWGHYLINKLRRP